MQAIELDLARYRARLLAELTKQRDVSAECNAVIDELALASDQESLDARTSICRVQTRVIALIDVLEHALARIDMGTYGRCDACDQPIGEARLEALPATSRCIQCAGAS